MQVPKHYNTFTSQAAPFLNSVYTLFFKNTAIVSFKYERCYKDGHGFMVSTIGSELGCSYYVDDLYPALNELEVYYELSRYVYVDRDFYKNHAVVDPSRWQKNVNLCESFAITERFFILDKTEEYFEIYGFTCDLENSNLRQFYIEHISFFERFIHYFRKTASQFIADCHKNRVMLGKHFLENRLIATNNELTDYKDKAFDSNIQNKPLVINNTVITTAEKKCLELIAVGYTMKQAAQKLLISPRTVEVHVRNIKDKLGVNYKSDLIQLWHKCRVD